MGGTLIVSRKTKLHEFFICKLKERGFKDVNATAVDKDGLNFIINDLKPALIFFDVEFYKSASCYMIRRLIKYFKKIKFVVVSLIEFPADLGMWLINNGVSSFLNLLEGEEQFFFGLDCIRNGKNYISPDVQARIDSREYLMIPAKDVTEREFQIWRSVCNGYMENEIADEMNLSHSTVAFHKKRLLNNLGVRNDKEAMKVAHYLKTFNDDELNFYGGRYQLTFRKPKTRNGIAI
jgi:DNA-binding NarL/FixJ family response regulator